MFQYNDRVVHLLPHSSSTRVENGRTSACLPCMEDRPEDLLQLQVWASLQLQAVSLHRVVPAPCGLWPAMSNDSRTPQTTKHVTRVHGSIRHDRHTGLIMSDHQSLSRHTSYIPLRNVRFDLGAMSDAALRQDSYLHFVSRIAIARCSSSR
jgi:hypothetical protein